MAILKWNKRRNRSQESNHDHRERFYLLRKWRSLPSLERLEDRLAPAITSAFNSGLGKLTVSSDGADSIAIINSAGNVKINGSDPTGGAVLSSAVKVIQVTG